VAITFPITGVSTAIGTATRSPSFTLGTSPIENDIILVVVSSTTTSATTDVSGWTNVRGTNTVTMPSDSVCAQVMVYHRVTAAEDTANQVTWTLTNLWNATEAGRISVTVLRGVALTGELGGVAFTSNAANAATPWVIPSVTPTVNGVAVAGVIGDGTGTEGAVSGWTIRASGSTTQTNYIWSRDAAVTSGVATSATSTTPSVGEEYVTIVAVFKEYVAPVTYERTGSLDGTSTLTGDGTRVALRTGTLDGTSTLTGTGEVETPSYSPSLWGTANVTLSDPSFSQSLWGTANVTLEDPPAVYERTGTIDGTSTLTGNGLRIASRTGTIDGTSTLTGTGLRIALRTGTIDGTSTLTGSALKIVSRTGTLDGISTLTGTGLRIALRTGTIDGTSTLTGTGEKILGFSTHERTGTLSGVSTLTGTGAILVPTMKRWNGTEWVAAVVKHGSGWPVVQLHNL